MIKLSVRLPGDHDSVYFHQPIPIDQADVILRGESSMTVPAQS